MPEEIGGTQQLILIQDGVLIEKFIQVRISTIKIDDGLLR
jgi:hypothetical protein